MHDADARLQRRTGRAQCQRPTVHGDHASVGPVLAAQNRDERGLAGSVFAEERADLTTMNGEVDVVVGEAVAKRLGDSPRLQHPARCVGGGPGIRSRPRVVLISQHHILARC